MKTIQTNLYRFDELSAAAKQQAQVEFAKETFLNTFTPLNQIWFTVSGLIYPVFNN